MKTTAPQRQEIRGRRHIEYGHDVCVLTLKERDALLADLEEAVKALRGCDELFDNYGFADESPCVRDREIVSNMLAVLDAYDSKGGDAT